MPYNGVPASMTGKMDDCVKSIMTKQGVSKSAAIAMCHDSIMKKDETMSDSRKKRKQEQILKAQKVEEVVEKVQPEGEPVETKELQAEEKDMGGMDSMYMPTFGATSFDALDAARTAAMEAENVRANATDLQSIIANIFYDDTITDKAAAVQQAAADFKTRMDGMDAMNKSKSKPNPIMEFVANLKAKMTRASINDLPDSAFAYIEPGGKKDASGKTTPRSLRHFPVHDAAHVRNALARMGQGAKFAKEAMAKVHAAAKKFGIDSAKKESNLRLYKDKAGVWHWIGIFSNNFEDTTGEIITEAAHKEFISYLDENPKNAPLFVPWHTLGAARKHRADFWDYTDGFMMIGGKLEEKEALALQEMQKQHPLGMSHGFFALEHDPKNEKHITKYRTFEVSDLPLENAANPFTGLNLILKEVAMGFKKEKREYLISQIGKEAVDALEKELKQGGNILQMLGVPSKEAEAPGEPEEENAVEEAVESEETETTPEAEAVATIAKAVSDELGMEELSKLIETQQKSIDGLTKTVEAQNKIIQKLSKSDDEKIAETIAPKSSLFWLQKGKRPSQSKENEIQSEEEVQNGEEPQSKEGGEELDWLQDALTIKAT